MSARTTINLTAEQLNILRHMLGISKPSAAKPEPYRDYYCAAKGDSELADLERIGAVRRFHAGDRYDWYKTTKIGRAAAIASFKTIQESKAARRYNRYLSCRECFPDLTFREFLTHPQFADTRKSA